MSFGKSVNFIEKDKDLVERIEKYQKDRGISFIGAVRELCAYALNVKEVK